jgi:mono/diheme cytochrome c family protein
MTSPRERLRRLLLAVLLLTPSLVMSSLLGAAESAPRAAVMDERHRALLKANCLACHGPEKQKGKFRVDELPFTITTSEAAERWQKVLNQVNAGEMPPEDEKQPTVAAKTDFLDDLANVMVAARRTLGDQQGVITMRRLNQREYRNTLRELLGVEIDVSELPTDGGSGSFDTVGANLFMSANQFEQYQALGREALSEAFAWQAAAGVTKKYRYEAEAWTPIVTKFVAYQLDARERARRWVQAVEEAAAKPENSDIVARLKKESKNDAIFRRSWEKVPGAPSPRSFGFDKKGENDADLANDSLGAGWLEYHQYYLRQPALDTGAYLGVETRHPSEIALGFMPLLVPFDWPVGDYMVRVRVAATKDAPPERRFLQFGIHPRSGRVMSTHQVTGTMEVPQVIEIPLTLTRGNADRDNRTLYIREKGSWDTNEEGGRKRGEAVKRNGIGPELALWVDWFEIERLPNADKPKPPGIAALAIPLDDKSPVPGPSELRAAFARFAQEAFRGAAPPVGFSDRLLALYEARRAAGDKPSAALQETLAVVLSSPMFLYLAEPAVDGRRRALTDPELAVRLAYFLWSAPPDATLRELARRGDLQKPEVLAAQADRLLDDPRAEAFIRAFVSQWLGMDRLDFFEINRALYPRFDNSTKLAAKNEVFETFSYVLRHNASLRELLKSDHVVIDSVLASYYGIAGVQGDAFRKVLLPPGSPRGGLLGMAAIHVMGGNGERSSPVERGAWVLRKLLHDPPPPAPANVPAITRLAGKVLTTHERLLAHQEDPQCASCHRKIDPIGFGLENFDAAGQWRTEDSYQAIDANGRPDPKTRKTWTIDAAAALHKGPAFKDFFGLRDLIAARADAFARGFSEALIEYALGRSVGFRDEPLIADMLGRSGKKDFAMREFIQALVASTEFHTK